MAAALALGFPPLGNAAPAAAGADNSLAAHFRTAPDAPPTQRELVDILVNGVAAGTLPIIVSNGKVTLPRSTLSALRITGIAGESLPLAGRSDISYRFDESKSVLSLTVPVAMLGLVRMGSGADAEAIRLSPETWGAFVNNDVNARRGFGGAAGAGGFGATTGAGNAGGFAWGGLADLHGLWPDVVANSGWAYDSTRGPGQALVRLDSNLTWRPAALDLAATAGDMVSIASLNLPAARPFRFLGIQVGTDYSGTPAWTSTPIASVSGTAQAQSTVDVYVNGQRQSETKTSGGPFSVILPPGAFGSTSSVVVTDVTGRAVILPLQAPRVDANLLRAGTLLWSAGAGVPRFNYGSDSADYDSDVYGFANARYGVSNRLAANLHVEAGPRLVEMEGGADASAAPWLATHVSLAASNSARGYGAFVSAGFSAAGPWHLWFDGTVARKLGQFEDVVSVSGRKFALRHGINPAFTEPANSEISGRLSWQPTSSFGLSASFQQFSYPGSPPTGFASVTANYLIGHSIPVFLNVSRNVGGQNLFAAVVGVTFTFGEVRTSANAGYQSGAGPHATGLTGGFNASQPLRDSPGDFGWQASVERQPGGIYTNADAEIRTGYGIPGVALTAFGDQTIGYATARGSVGVIDLHPFVADPVQGGIILADAGAPGVPVQLNGYNKGRSWFDGKLLIPDAVAGTPQRVAIDTSRLPMNMVSGETDGSAVVRSFGASVVAFAARSTASAAVVLVTVDGKPPPVGSTLVSAAASAPIDSRGRAYLPAIAKGEVLTVELAEGGTCAIRTKFDGRGGLTRKLGPFACEKVHP